MYCLSIQNDRFLLSFLVLWKLSYANYKVKVNSFNFTVIFYQNCTVGYFLYYAPKLMAAVKCVNQTFRFSLT